MFMFTESKGKVEATCADGVVATGGLPDFGMHPFATGTVFFLPTPVRLARRTLLSSRLSYTTLYIHLHSSVGRLQDAPRHTNEYRGDLFFCFLRGLQTRSPCCFLPGHPLTSSHSQIIPSPIMNAAQLLQDSLSSNQAARESATQQLEAAARDNFVSSRPHGTPQPFRSQTTNSTAISTPLPQSSPTKARASM